MTGMRIFQRRLKKNAPEKLLNHITRQMTSRFQVGLNLMNELDWDFTMIVFRGTDTAQHFLPSHNSTDRLSYLDRIGRDISNPEQYLGFSIDICNTTVDIEHFLRSFSEILLSEKGGRRED